MFFGEWMNLQELFDVDKPTDIRFEKTSDGWYHTFMHEGEQIVVSLSEGPFVMPPVVIPHVWHIAFRRGGKLGSWKLTQSSSNPHSVYAEVMRAVKALMEQTTVNGLSWEAFDARTLSLYDRMFQRMLPDFVRVNEMEVVRRDKLEAAVAKLNPEQREKFNARVANEIEAFSRKKADIQQKLQAFKRKFNHQLMNKIVSYRGEPHIVVALPNHYVTIRDVKGGRLTVPADEVTPLGQVDPAVRRELIRWSEPTVHFED